MNRCLTCVFWKRNDMQRGKGMCAWIWVNLNQTMYFPPDFGCVKHQEEKPKGPFFVHPCHSPGLDTTPWIIRIGEARSPQLKKQNQAQEWCDFLNELWSVKGIDDIDISSLYRTIGSKMWLDSLIDSELKAIARDIYRPLLAFLWCNGYVDLPVRERE